MIPVVPEGYSGDYPVGIVEPTIPGMNRTNNFGFNPEIYNVTSSMLVYVSESWSSEESDLSVSTNICQQFPFRNASTIYFGSNEELNKEDDNSTATITPTFKSTNGQQSLSAIPFSVLGLSCLAMLK